LVLFRYDSLREATVDYLKNVMSNDFQSQLLTRAEIAEQNTDEALEMNKDKTPPCFPSGTRVTLNSNFFKPIESLIESDKLHSFKLHGISNLKIREEIETPFFTYLHYDPEVELEYLVLEFSNRNTLTVSEEHMIFAVSEGSEGIHCVRGILAGKFCVGDKAVYCSAGSQSSFEIQTCVSIIRKKCRGAYSPLTGEGTFLADGFLVSSYADVESFFLAQTALWLLKAFHSTKRIIKDITTGFKSTTTQTNVPQRTINEYKSGIHPFAKVLMLIRDKIQFK
jgi:hypothetical protein